MKEGQLLILKQFAHIVTVLCTLLENQCFLCLCQSLPQSCLLMTLKRKALENIVEKEKIMVANSFSY